MRPKINRLPQNLRYQTHEVRWKRYEKPEPGHRIQVDVKFLERIKGPAYIKPRQPRLNGKVERSHKIDEEESYRMLEKVVADDAELFHEKLREWENFYIHSRPHGALGGQTLYERFREKIRFLCKQ